ncbi:MAG TPA: M28 family peptidase [Bryobacteraceae bacterium]|nr:M28 family peptidase [Bryobacteraceae bacterium]
MKVHSGALLLAAISLAAAEPAAKPATKPNAATRQWWRYITALANDSMEGRDTGSAAYERAARYVAAQFESEGLQPAGEKGYFQSVPMRRVRLNTATSAVRIERGGVTRNLVWLHEITIAAAPGLPHEIDAPLVFRGSSPEPPADLHLSGKIIVRLSPPVGTPAANVPQPPLPEGSVATLGIDNFDGPERRRWPAAYAVNVALAETPPTAHPVPTLFLNPSAAEALFAGSGHTYAELKKRYDAGQPLPWFEIPAKLRATLRFDSSNIASDNIIGVLPGSDPLLRDQYVVVSAHLDGYGFGEPIHGDRLYNGAFDDAAYVATLLDLAARWKSSSTRLRRSVLFAVFTGEEKGLLGSRYFVAHPTVPKDRMVCDINLDQLRPLFPLKLLTMLALGDSTLGDTARAVAAPMGIRIQPDPEPDRNLMRRADHYNFIRAGIPAAGFVFGYEKGSPEEVLYRRWYADRYHSPSDDLTQPWDPEAAAKFNEFFRRLVENLANADARPQWKAGSKLAPHEKKL